VATGAIKMVGELDASMKTKSVVWMASIKQMAFNAAMYARLDFRLDFLGI
jgi:hypothetical protein